jgi:phosphinothricin acetyltransferase
LVGRKTDALRIEPACRRHLQAITEIYNDAVVNTTATFDSAPRTIEEQEAWMDAHGDRYPIIIASIDVELVGWGSLSAHGDRDCYRNTAEDSVYVRSDFRGRGIGTRILDVLVGEARRSGYHALIARIDAGNEASIALHAAAGFEEVGMLREVGYKFGRWLDVVLMELLL